MILGILRFAAAELAAPALERTGQAIGNRIARLIDPNYHPPEGAAEHIEVIVDQPKPPKRKKPGK